MLRSVHAALFSALALSLAAAPAAHAQGRSDLVLGLLSAQHVPDEVLVQLARGAPEDRKAAAVGRAHGARVERLVSETGREDGQGDLELVRLPPGLAVAEAVGALESDPDVEFA